MACMDPGYIKMLCMKKEFWLIILADLFVVVTPLITPASQVTVCTLWECCASSLMRSWSGKQCAPGSLLVALEQCASDVKMLVYSIYSQIFMTRHKVWTWSDVHIERKWLLMMWAKRHLHTQWHTRVSIVMACYSHHLLVRQQLEAQAVLNAA